MKKWFTYILFILAAFTNCQENDKKIKTAERQTAGFINRIFQGNNENETTDSVRIDSFVTINQEFEPFRNKIQKFYRRRNYELAWSEKGEFLPHASMFLNLLKNSEKLQLVQGFGATEKLRDTLDYAINERKSRKENTELRQYIDLQLTSMYFSYSQQSWKGQIEPDEEGIPWYITRKKIRYGKTLDSILASDGANPFTEYMPVHPEYRKLIYTLYELKAFEKAGGWPAIQLPAGKNALEEKYSGNEVLALRRRLNISKDLRTNDKNPVFTPELTAALKNFQKRHGLAQDGICAGETLRELNTSIEARIKQVLVNLERWKWVPERIEKNYIVINIPDYYLNVFENDSLIWKMKVIVGAQMDNTPIFNDKLEYIVVNPSWNVPKSIAAKEFLPLIRKNPAILEQQNFEVYQGKETNVIDPFLVPWDSLSEENFNYSLRQLPGEHNALGKIKFLFPNNFSVYLHDTPNQHLFEKDKRSFSHGCIRLQEPLKLAEYLLRKNQEWNPDKLRNLPQHESTWIKLSRDEQLPVYILYFTVWVDENGEVNYRNDIYGHDKKMADLMFQ